MSENFWRGLFQDGTAPKNKNWTRKRVGRHACPFLNFTLFLSVGAGETFLGQQTNLCHLSLQFHSVVCTHWSFPTPTERKYTLARTYFCLYCGFKGLCLTPCRELLSLLSGLYRIISILLVNFSTNDTTHDKGNTENTSNKRRYMISSFA